MTTPVHRGDILHGKIHLRVQPGLKRPGPIFSLLHQSQAKEERQALRPKDPVRKEEVRKDRSLRSIAHTSLCGRIVITEQDAVIFILAHRICVRS